MTVELTLVLDAPRLRREAFPCGAAEVEVSATISSSTGLECRHCTHIRLPSTSDLSVLFRRECVNQDDAAKKSSHSDESQTIYVRVVGSDHGMSFALGTAVVEVPIGLKPSLTQNARRSDPFVLCIKDDEGARIGSLSGHFVASRCVDSPHVKTISDGDRARANSVEVDGCSKQDTKVSVSQCVR